MTSSQPPSMIENITTRWPMIRNPVQFVMRYAPAIRKYVGAVVRNPDDADDVTQDFLMRVMDKGFCPDNVVHGRFRDYLKAAIRYAAISHLRRRAPAQISAEQLDSLIQPDPPDDRAWADEWRACLLERAWQALELHQQKTPGNLSYTVLRSYVDNPKEGSEARAAMLSKQVGRPLRADAVRQQYHRARKHFAELMIEEIRQTLHNPSDESIQQELVDLQLLTQVQQWL